MPTKAQLLDEITELNKVIKGYIRAKNETTKSEAIVLRLDGPININMNDSNMERMESKPNLLSKRCPACEANQVNVKYNTNRLELRCPTCTYGWSEPSANNKDGDE